MHCYKLALNGSTKRSTGYTGCVEDRVCGVVYSLEHSQQSVLDQAEGPPLQSDAIRAASAGRLQLAPVQAVASISLSLDETVEPYHWYRQFVLAGTLPAPYVALIQTTVSQDDPDTERQRTNSNILRVAACV